MERTKERFLTLISALDRIDTLHGGVKGLDLNVDLANAERDKFGVLLPCNFIWIVSYPAAQVQLPVVVPEVLL